MAVSSPKSCTRKAVTISLIIFEIIAIGIADKNNIHFFHKLWLVIKANKAPRASKVTMERIPEQASTTSKDASGKKIILPSRRTVIPIICITVTAIFEANNLREKANSFQIIAGNGIMKIKYINGSNRIRVTLSPAKNIVIPRITIIIDVLFKNCSAPIVPSMNCVSPIKIRAIPQLQGLMTVFDKSFLLLQTMNPVIKGIKYP